MSDHFHPLTLLGDVLTNEEHVSEEETVDVYLGGGALLHLEVPLHQEMSPLAHGAGWHGRREVQVGTGGQETKQLLIFGFLGLVGLVGSLQVPGHTYNRLVRVNPADDIFQSLLLLSLPHVTVDIPYQ